MPIGMGNQSKRFNNKQFVGATNGGGGIVNVVAATPEAWETFDIIRNLANSNQVHIKVSNGMYMQAMSKDQMTTNSNELSPITKACTIAINKLQKCPLL